VSTRRRRAEERLTSLGERPVDGPNPRFTFSLERRLVGAASLAAGATLVALPSRHRSWLPLVSMGAATVATVVLAGALFGAFGPGGSDVLQLAAAVNTTVVMPGGHTVAGHSGLDLPNGSVVWTGPNGSASAGTVEMGPGIEAIVDSGTLRLSPLASAGPTLSGSAVPVATPAVGSAPVAPPAASPSNVVPTTLPKPVPTTIPVTTTTLPHRYPPVPLLRRR
jgi:hypothetical protein